MSKTRSTKPRNRALATAVAAAGGQSALGQRIGVPQPTISDWLFKTGKPDPEKCVDIERVTGVRCEALCPDVFGRFMQLRKSARSSGATP
jgi:DNA-binding transcriptional regulator YdaS (Cro superfamily)